jgi:hypothetical protein
VFLPYLEFSLFKLVSIIPLISNFVLLTLPSLFYSKLLPRKRQKAAGFSRGMAGGYQRQDVLLRLTEDNRYVSLHENSEDEHGARDADL